MSKRPAETTNEEEEELLTFLEEQAGSVLRGVARYGPDDYHFLSIRDDVESSYERGDLDELVALYRDEETLDERHESALQVGSHHATVRVYDDAIVLHFPQGERVGTVVALDATAAPDLTGFVGRCLKHLYEDSPQEIANAPDW